MKAVAKAEAMQASAHDHFRLRALRLDASHYRAASHHIDMVRQTAAWSLKQEGRPTRNELRGVPLTSATDSILDER